MQVRVPKDEFLNSKKWALDSLKLSSIKNSDVFKFLYHTHVIGDVGKVKRIGKKGSWLDVGYFVAIIAFFAICLLIGTVLLNGVNNSLQASDGMGTEGKALAQKITTKFIATNNSMFLILVIGLFIVSIALAALVRVHPVFIPIFLLALIFLVWISATLSDAYQMMAADPNMAASAAQYNTVALVIGNLPLFTAIVGFIIMIVMYKTWQS